MLKQIHFKAQENPGVPGHSEINDVSHRMNNQFPAVGIGRKSDGIVQFQKPLPVIEQKSEYGIAAVNTFILQYTPFRQDVLRM